MKEKNPLFLLLCSLQKLPFGVGSHECSSSSSSLTFFSQFSCPSFFSSLSILLLFTFTSRSASVPHGAPWSLGVTDQTDPSFAFITCSLCCLNKNEWISFCHIFQMGKKKRSDEWDFHCAVEQCQLTSSVNLSSLEIFHFKNWSWCLVQTFTTEFHFLLPLNKTLMQNQETVSKIRAKFPQTVLHLCFPPVWLKVSHNHSSFHLGA